MRAVAASDDRQDGKRKSRPEIDQIEGRWVVGTPAVPDFGKRTLAAAVLMLVLIGTLYLLAG